MRGVVAQTDEDSGRVLSFELGVLDLFRV